jgi:hypothetical protein
VVVCDLGEGLADVLAHVPACREESGACLPVYV